MDKEVFEKLKTIQQILLSRSIRHEMCLKDLQFASHIIDELLREENNGKASR
jgi:hypothetical protein